VTKYIYSGGVNNTKVILYKIDQMGHTWPMGPQYLPVPLIGNVCEQININEAIWEDLKEVRLPK
jgi:polyhydroxybutyrate depolymerase